MLLQDSAAALCDWVSCGPLKASDLFTHVDEEGLSEPVLFKTASEALELAETEKASEAVELPLRDGVQLMYPSVEGESHSH